MDRTEVIERLKAVRSRGVDLRIKLTAKTSLLLQTWERLNPKLSPKKLSPKREPLTPEKKQQPEEQQLHDGLLHQLLPRLQLRTLYRLHFFNKKVREIVDNKYFWMKLIERDVGVVPDFIANTSSQLRLYYLKKMNFNVPLTIYGLNELDEVIEKANNVVFSDKEVIIYNNNTIYNLTNNQLSQVDLIGRSIKERRYNNWSKENNLSKRCLLSTDGRLYNYEGNELEKPLGLPSNEIITDIGDRHILMRSGKVYIKLKGSTQAIETVIGEPIVSLVGDRMLSKTGKYYKYKTIRYDEVNEVVPDGELDLKEYRWEPISEKFPLYIESDGKVSDKKSPPTMYFGVYTALWKYYMVSVYEIDIVSLKHAYHRSEYRFRGFKK